MIPLNHQIRIHLTPTQIDKCKELGVLLCAYPLEVLDTVLRDPAVQDALERFIDTALDRQLAVYRRRNGKPPRMEFPK